MKKNRVLIVDDDVLFAEGLSDILTEKGYKTMVTYSGNDALRAIKELNFDIVFLDMKLPIMNGLQIYERIRSISSHIPVIIMTAFSMENLIKDALKKGVSSVLYKPLDINKVLETINNIKLNNFERENGHRS